MGNKITVGFLVLLLFSTGLYITLNDDVRLRVDHDKSTFYVKNDNNRWVVSGREYNRLFDGNSIMYRSASDITVNTDIDEENEQVKITRTTPYIRGPVIKDTYIFDGKIDDVELFPVSHKVEIYNASGFFYRYSIDDLTGVPEKQKLNTASASFGRNMKVEWDSGYRWAWIGWPYGCDSMSVQYDIDSNYEIFSVRLFDPPSQPGATTDYWKNYTSPTNKKLNGISFVNETLAFAVGNEGTILKWDGSWYNETSPTNLDLIRIEMLNSTFGFTVGGNGSNSSVVKWNGTDWSNFTLPGLPEGAGLYDSRLAALYVKNESFITTAPKLDQVFEIKQWNGSQWINQSDFNSTEGGVYNMDLNDDATYGYAIGDASLEGSYIWNGTVWASQGGGNRYPFCEEWYCLPGIHTIGNITYTSGQENRGNFIVWKHNYSDDTYTSWEMEASGNLYEGLHDIYIFNNSFGMVVAIDGIIKEFNGTDWFNITSPVSTDLQGLDFYDENLGFSVGDGGVIIQYNIYPQISVNYSSNCQDPFQRRFRITNLTEQDVEPECQNSTNALYNITNNGPRSGSYINISLTESLVSGIEMECNTTDTDYGWVNLTTSYQIVYNQTIAVNESVPIWCRIDLDNPTEGQISDLNFTIAS